MRKNDTIARTKKYRKTEQGKKTNIRSQVRSAVRRFVREMGSEAEIAALKKAVEVRLALMHGEELTDEMKETLELMPWITENHNHPNYRMYDGPL